MGWSDLLVTGPLSVFGLVFASVLTKSSPLRFVSGSWSFLPIDVAVTGVHSLPCSLWSGVLVVV